VARRWSVVALFLLVAGTLVGVGRHAPWAEAVDANPPNGDPVLLATGDVASCVGQGDEATAALLEREPDATVAALQRPTRLRPVLHHGDDVLLRQWLGRKGLRRELEEADDRPVGVRQKEGPHVHEVDATGPDKTDIHDPCIPVPFNGQIDEPNGGHPSNVYRLVDGHRAGADERPGIRPTFATRGDEDTYSDDGAEPTQPPRLIRRTRRHVCLW